METPFAMYDALTSIDVAPEKVRMVVQSMEHDMALFATRSQFDALTDHAAARYEMLRAEMAASRERIDQLAQRFDDLDHRFEQVDRRFEQVDKRFEQVDKRFEQVDKRFEQVDKRFDLVDERFRLLQREMLAMEQRLEHRLTIKLGSFLVVAIGVTATVVHLLRG